MLGRLCASFQLAQHTACSVVSQTACSVAVQSGLVLQTRNIDGETGLKLVRDGPADLLWRYLDYIVCQQGTSDPALHTELALTLVDVALRLHLPTGQTHCQSLSFPG